MATVQQMIDSQSNGTCGTLTVRGLSLQIIAEMNLLIPNALVSIDDLNIAAGEVVNPFLQPAAKEALRRAIKKHGGTLEINSAFRTVAQQHLLRSWFERGQCNIGGAALPGQSNHEDGLALDIPEFGDWRASLESESWDWLGDTNPKDPVHFTFLGNGVRDDIGSIGVNAFQNLWNKNNPNDPIATDGQWGPQTATRMNQSPAEGFGAARFLRLVSPPMQGDDVRKVQKALVDAGFLSPDIINGTYDNSTEAAVKSFQDKRGLSNDGIVGPATRKALGL